MDSGEGLEMAGWAEPRRKHAHRSCGTALAEGGDAVGLHAPGQHLGIDTAAHKVSARRTYEAHAVGWPSTAPRRSVTAWLSLRQASSSAASPRRYWAA
jgi:hypothetical protein